MTDLVNPAHYKKQNGIECIDYLEAICLDIPGDEAVCVANAVKYLSRYRQKNPLNPKRDVEKALWYVNRLVQIIQDKEDDAKLRSEFMEYLVDDAAKLVNEELIYGVPQTRDYQPVPHTRPDVSVIDSAFWKPDKNRKEDEDLLRVQFHNQRDLHPALRDKQ
jgi:hypothetical protein